MSDPNLTLLGRRDFRFGMPETIANFDAGGYVDHDRQATVVAQEPRLAAEADEAVDLGRVRIDGHQGAGHGTEFTQDVAIEAPTGNILGFERAAKEVAIFRVRFYRLADDKLDLESAFVYLLRQVDDMPSHAWLGGRKRLQVIGGEGELNAREREQCDGYDGSYCLSRTLDRAVTPTVQGFDHNGWPFQELKGLRRQVAS